MIKCAIVVCNTPSNVFDRLGHYGESTWRWASKAEYTGVAECTNTGRITVHRFSTSPNTPCHLDHWQRQPSPSGTEDQRPQQETKAPEATPPSRRIINAFRPLPKVPARPGAKSGLEWSHERGLMGMMKTPNSTSLLVMAM